MTYLVDNKQYHLSYAELKDKYITYCTCANEWFLHNLPKIIHLACIICFLKEIPTYNCLSDEGIIHKLIHLLDNTENTERLSSVRKLFEEQCKLS